MSTMNKFGLQALSLSLLASLGSACVGEAPDSDELVGEAAQAAVTSTGTAIAFSGAGLYPPYAHIPMGNTIPTNPVSIEVWFKTDTVNQEMPLMGLYTQDPIAQVFVDWTQRLFLKATGQVCSRVKNNGNEHEVCSFTGKNWADGQWHHAEATVGPAFGHCVYVDGMRVGPNNAATQAIQFIDGGSTEILLARNAWANANGSEDNYFTGTLDEARIWSFERQLANVRGGAFREHPADPTYLRGLWRLNDGSGLEAADSSGHGHPGSLRDPAWIAEDPGAGVLNAPIYNKSLNVLASQSPAGGNYASVWIEDEDNRLSFNYVDASTNRTMSFTLEAWVHPTYKYQTGEVGAIIGDSGAYILSLCASPTAGMNRVCYVLNDNNGGYTFRETTIEVPVDAWTHLALVHLKQSPNSKGRVFKNGVMELEETLNGNILYYGSTSHEKLIGNQGSGPMQFYGYIDDVRVWPSARTAAEIQSFMHWQVGGANVGLRAMWHMNGLVPGMTNEIPESTTGALNNHTNGVMLGSASLSTMLSPSTQNVD